MPSSDPRAVVLLIDDQPMVGELVRRSLAGANDITFEYCSDPKLAIETALRVRPTVVLQDLVMPDVSGLTLVRFFRRHPELKAIPIVVMSSKEDPADKAEVFAAGANDYLVKPPHQIELLARIRYHSNAYRSQQSLVELNARLEEASRAKGDFLATMSHEIRTPLNGILGVVQLLEHTQLTAQQESYLETIRASGQVLLAVINDILDVSKVESGKLALEHIPFDFRELLEEVLRLMGPSAKEKSLVLSGYLAPSLPDRLLGDPVRLRQVLFNLISNALKFTPKGEVSVSIDCLQIKDGQAEIAIAVRDSGIGISPDAQKRLFSPFTQADSSTTRKYGGTGLGLVIVRQLAHLMGAGEASLQSVPGQGSTFTAKIKLEVAAEATLVKVGGPNLKVLVVADQPWSREGLGRMLGDLRLPWKACVEVSQARKALEDEGGFGIVLLETADDLSASHLESWCCGISNPPRLLRLVSPGAVSVNGANPRPSSAQALASLLWPSTSAPLKGQSQRASTPVPAPVRRTEKLLVAEDNPINQVIIEGLLEHLGYQIDIAGDGNEVVEMARRGTYQAILMDVEMPGQDGYEATRELRQLGVTLPIIAMTAYAMAEDRKRCLDSGMNDFLTKPLELALLAEALERWTAVSLKSS